MNSTDERAHLASGRGPVARPADGAPGASAARLASEDVERIAERVVELLQQRQEAAAAPVRFVDAATLAATLGVKRDWVYAHAKQLGAIRLGGPYGRLRFDLNQLPPSATEPPAAGPRAGGLGARARTTYSRTGPTRNTPRAPTPGTEIGSAVRSMRQRRTSGGDR